MFFNKHDSSNQGHRLYLRIDILAFSKTQRLKSTPGYARKQFRSALAVADSNDNINLGFVYRMNLFHANRKDI